MSCGPMRAAALRDTSGGGYPAGLSLEGGPEEWTEAGQLRRAVSRALGKLSPEQRQLISLAYYGGFSQSEIGEKLGLPLGTVKTRIRAGMSVLRAQLQDRSGEEPA